jgi:hypothetical protein
VFGKLRRASSELGFWNAVAYGLDQVLARRPGLGGLVRYYFYAQPVPPQPERPLRMGKQEIRELKAGDAAFADLPLDDDVLEYRFAQDATCLAIIEEGRAVACIWFCYDQYVEDMVRATYRLAPEHNTAWDFDVYVAPTHRAGRTFARLWQAGNDYLRGRGVEWSLSRISAYNVPSITSHERLGARRLGQATFFKLGPFQLMISSLGPYFHVSWGEGGPTLLISALK